MKTILRVFFVSGEFVDVVCSAPDFVKFETKFDVSIAALANNAKFTHLSYLAWAALFRTKQTVKEFDDWILEIDTVGAGESDPK